LESLKILSYTEKNVKEPVHMSLARNLYSLMSYRRNYAVLYSYINEPQTVWAETEEHEVHAVSFGNKRCSETYTYSR
jgi:hypothetical protein